MTFCLIVDHMVKMRECWNYYWKQAKKQDAPEKSKHPVGLVTPGASSSMTPVHTSWENLGTLNLAEMGVIWCSVTHLNAVQNTNVSAHTVFHGPTFVMENGIVSMGRKKTQKVVWNILKSVKWCSGVQIGQKCVFILVMFVMVPKIVLEKMMNCCVNWKQYHVWQDASVLDLLCIVFTSKYLC